MKAKDKEEGRDAFIGITLGYIAYQLLIMAGVI